MKSYFGTIIAAVIQLVALLSYLAAYCNVPSVFPSWLPLFSSAVCVWFAVPGGLTTLRFGGQMALRGAGGALPF